MFHKLAELIVDWWDVLNAKLTRTDKLYDLDEVLPELNTSKEEL